MNLLEPKIGSTRIVAVVAGATLLLTVACGTSAAPAESPERNESAPVVRTGEIPRPSESSATSMEPTGSALPEQLVEVTAEASVGSEMQPIAETVPVGNNVGQRVPDFTIRLIDGTTVTSAELLKDGQPTFLFFFESW